MGIFKNHPRNRGRRGLSEPDGHPALGFHPAVAVVHLGRGLQHQAHPLLGGAAALALGEKLGALFQLPPAKGGGEGNSNYPGTHGCRCRL